MSEHRQMTIEVKHLTIALLEGEFVSDGGATGRDNGQLNLRHPEGCIQASENAKLVHRLSSLA
ncbi:MAG: hypothetical protein ACKVY0_24025 [Prosthecobacter sp.]|uniref:hypothetical protein n=1 Tax=Prosthecobacter sp. TaxID=1965333 RepID=UPI0038FD4D5F